MSLRIRRDDRVKVMAGKDKGTVAKVLAVYPDKNRAIVENVNLVKRHVRARSQEQRGGILDAKRRFTCQT